MKEILKLIEVKEIEEKKSNDNRTYIRVTFKATDKDNNEVEVRSSISENQWKDLRTKMGITFNEEFEELETSNTILIEFDPKETTKSKNPKPLIELNNGIYKGNKYNYFELNVGVLIENNIVQKEKIKKDYSKFF